MNSGLLALQVRSLAGLQHQPNTSPTNSSPKSSENTHTKSVTNIVHSPSLSPRSPQNKMANSISSSSSNIDIEDIKPLPASENVQTVSPTLVPF